MSREGHSTLREQALAMQRLLNVVPDPRIRIVHGQKQLGLFGDVAQVLHQRGARRACLQVRFVLGPASAFNDVRQYFLKLLAIHFSHPLPTCCCRGNPKHVLCDFCISVVLRLPRAASRVMDSVLLSAAMFYLRAAFSALLSFNRSRNFMRALCNCDLLLPIEHPIISAISLCS